MSEMETVSIYNHKGKLQTLIEMPRHTRVAQISWSRWGKVDEISFQFGGGGTEDIEIHEGEADTERAVGFVVNPVLENEDEDGEEEG